MLTAWPAGCPRCKVRHLSIPMTTEDHAIIGAEQVAEEVERQVWARLVTEPLVIRTNGHCITRSGVS